ncbi:TetR/AcrR family transcriptional regulator [Actinomadura litoris]|uniref:TetR/AcrR family transcriptional regulator n=1 Tax=Actinomadura litoris TaxID=2678616 RepID=UPI001FA7A347|nr:TetR/AcrR family transcriptional regulator [Actinomadura litoris]
MSVRERREREYAHRHQLIIDTARRLAETDGWSAVTTRRLADTIEYSQPVLYSHFKEGKDAIVGAVALQGFDELAALLREARESTDEPGTALHRVAHAYTEFALANPALYDAMFMLSSTLRFGEADTPAVLEAAFQELYSAVAEVTGGKDLETCTEAIWSALHGLVTLLRSGRLRPGHHAARLDLLLDRFTFKD